MRRNLLLTGLLLVAMLVSVNVQATIYRIGNWTVGTSDYATLQEFITAGVGKTADDEIWVAAGTQELTTQWVINNYRGKLIGGFKGTETDASEREWVANGKPWELVNKTILKLATKVDPVISSDVNSYQSILRAASGSTFSEINGITFDGTKCTASVIALRTVGSGPTTIKNCIVENGTPPTDNDLTSTADYEAGGINIGRPNNTTVSTTINIENCLIQNNTGRIGAIYTRGALNVLNSVIRNNTATENGGAIVTRGAYPTTIVNSIISENTAAGNGGAIYAFTAPLTISNTTIANNRGAGSGGLFIAWTSTAATAVGKVYNSIFYNNQLTDNTVNNLVNSTEKQLTFNNNIIDVVPTGETVTAAENIVETDVANLFTPTTFVPVANFVGINKGTAEVGTLVLPETDLAGNARISGGTIDIGPYETISSGSDIAKSAVANAKVYAQAGVLTVESATPQTVSVYTVTGALVYSQAVNGKATITSLAHGLYIVKLGIQAYKVIL
jgi:hypothetical protein